MRVFSPGAGQRIRWPIRIQQHDFLSALGEMPCRPRAEHSRADHHDIEFFLRSHSSLPSMCHPNSIPVPGVRTPENVVFHVTLASAW